jgi:hypothetical protein
METWWPRALGMVAEQWPSFCFVTPILKTWREGDTGPISG